MAFLTAILSGLGGFQQGRQQRNDYSLAQQQQADTHAYEQQQTADERARTGIAQQEEQASQDTRQRNLGIDPVTKKPFVIPAPLTQVVPNNKGRAATPQDLYKHYSSLARYYISTGQTDAANIAAAQAGDIQRQMIQANTIAAQNARDIYNQGHMDQRTAEIIAGANQRNVLTTDTSRANNQDTVGGAMNRTLVNQAGQNTRDVYNQGQQTSRNAANVAQRYTAQANNDLRNMETQNAMATREGKPTPYPNLEEFKQGLAASLAAVAKDPKQLATRLRNLELRAAQYGPQLLIYARRQLQDAAREAGQAQFLPVPGGNAPQNLPPPPPPPLP